MQKMSIQSVNSLLQILWRQSEFEPQNKKYTKTEINVMPKSDLINLAIEEGIAEAEGLNGSELKKLLIEKFGL